MGDADHVGYGLVEEKLPEVGYAGWYGSFLTLSSVRSLHADYFPSEFRNFRGPERSTRTNGDEQPMTVFVVSRPGITTSGRSQSRVDRSMSNVWKHGKRKQTVDVVNKADT